MENIGFLHSFVGSQVLFILARVTVNKDEPKAAEQPQSHKRQYNSK